MTEIRTKIAEDLKKEFTKGNEVLCVPEAGKDEVTEPVIKQVCEKHYAD